MKINQSGPWLSLVFGALAATVSAGIGTSGHAIAPSTAAVSKISDVLAIEQAANGKLLAIGRLDSISRTDFIASVLGQKFILLGDRAVLEFVKGAEVGQAVSLFGELVGDQYFVDSAVVLPGSYVPGASRVYLRAHLASGRNNVGAFSVGAIELDVSTSSEQSLGSAVGAGSVTTAIGSQPAIAGKILVERFSRVSSVLRRGVEASVGTGRSDASLGTGKSDASLGTGRSDASLGTGKSDASLGTGRSDASLGTGKTDASLGTGRSAASVGTGRPDASLGTGKTDASIGAGGAKN